MFSPRPRAACFASLLASFSVIACDKSDSEPGTSPDAAPSTMPDAAPAMPDAPSALTTCYQVPDFSCQGETAPATDVAAFVRDNALPLSCGDGTWDLAIFEDRFVDQKIFMVGEVHGTNEIGIVSDRIVRHLASKNLVNVVAMEMPMDLQPIFEDYVATGGGAAPQIMQSFADHFFGVMLPKAARELVRDGHQLEIRFVDTPMGTEMSVRAIEAIAETLVQHKSLVLDTLPEALDPQTFPSGEYAAAAEAYFEHIEANLATICTELDEARCDELINMARAIYVTVAFYAANPNVDKFFSVREEVIYYNLRQQMDDENDRMFLHMGAFHTNKNLDTRETHSSAGSRMAHEYAGTKDRVYSAAVGYGPGSRIYYGGETLEMPASPPAVADALADQPFDPYFISTTLPDSACVGNPLAAALDDFHGAAMGSLYDAYFIIKRLTPESSPGEATLRKRSPASPLAARLVDHLERLHRLEQLRATRR